MRVWITRYALTKGILEQEVDEFDKYPTMVRAGGSTLPGEYYHKPDWHTIWEEAVARAEEMRVAKIRALKKQLAKLEGLRFDAQVEAGR